MRYLYFITIIFLLYSCSKSDDGVQPISFTENKFPQEWKLVKMTIGMIPNSETSGQEMPMQETYVFNEEGSFSKTRIVDGDSTTVQGTFIYQETKEAIILEHNSINKLIGNCSSKKKTEYLYFLKGDAYLHSDWHACDGPSLLYEIVNVD